MQYNLDEIVSDWKLFILLGKCQHRSKKKKNFPVQDFCMVNLMLL